MRRNGITTRIHSDTPIEPSSGNYKYTVLNLADC